MRRDDVVHILREHMDELREMGVTSLELFGSVARDDARPDSDVDLLVELDPDKPIGLFEYAGIQLYIEDLLGDRPVDLTMRNWVYEELRDDIYGEAIRVA